MGICHWQIHDRSDLGSIFFWMPKFLNTNYGLKITQIGLPLVVIYVAADIGSIGGGWLSSMLIKRNWSLNKARKTAMLVLRAGSRAVMLAAPRLAPLGCRCVCWFGAARTRVGARTSSRWPQTCFRVARSVRSLGLAAWLARLAAC